MDTSRSAAPGIPCIASAPIPGRWSGLSAGARLRRGLAGFRCAAVAAGTELTRDIRQIPGPLRCLVPASLIGVSWHLPAPDVKAVR
jgi:hypothetical protein